MCIKGIGSLEPRWYPAHIQVLRTYRGLVIGRDLLGARQSTTCSIGGGDLANCAPVDIRSYKLLRNVLENEAEVYGPEKAVVDSIGTGMSVSMGAPALALKQKAAAARDCYAVQVPVLPLQHVSLNFG